MQRQQKNIHRASDLRLESSRWPVVGGNHILIQPQTSYSRRTQINIERTKAHNPEKEKGAPDCCRCCCCAMGSQNNKSMKTEKATSSFAHVCKRENDRTERGPPSFSLRRRPCTVGLAPVRNAKLRECDRSILLGGDSIRYDMTDGLG